MTVQKSDYFNFYSHFTGAVAALAGYLVLLYKTDGSIPLVIVSTVYGICTMFIFICSSIYHGQKKEEDLKNPWRRLDHIAIFFMIAGTYTPICYVYLNGWWCWGIIGAQWLLVLLGLLFKLLYIQSPRWLTATIYVLMGWMVLIPLGELLKTMPVPSLWLLLAGGIAYTVGGVIYAAKRPNPFPGVFGFHGIFHILILAGAILHYLVVYTAISGSKM